MFIKEHQWGEWKVGSQGRLAGSAGEALPGLALQ